jgi:hypothetical protein
VAMYGLTLLAIRVLLFALDDYCRREHLYTPSARDEDEDASPRARLSCRSSPDTSSPSSWASHSQPLPLRSTAYSPCTWSCPSGNSAVYSSPAPSYRSCAVSTLSAPGCCSSVEGGNLSGRAYSDGCREAPRETQLSTRSFFERHG